MSDETSPLARIDHAPQTLRDIAQEKIREAIIEGRFAPGERLVERTLCDQMGVSRTVVRETLRYLEAEGLVTLGTGRGPIVAQMDWEQARQIYDIRAQLEGAAVAKLAEIHNEKTLTQLRRAHILLKTASASGDRTRLFKASTEFYETIFSHAGHHIAWEVVSRLNGRISRLRAITLSTQDRLKPGLAHMTGIFDAIVARDAEGARRAVTAHIADAAEVARRALETQGECEDAKSVLGGTGHHH